MMRRAATMGLALAVLAAATVDAQAPSDPEVGAGNRTAARRLAADAARVREMAQACLYLGIAYVGKGHEAAAKAKFREALAGMKDLSPSGVAVAAGGGGGGSETAGGTPQATTATETYTGLLTPSQSAAQIPLPVPQAAGHWRAELEDAATREGVTETQVTAPTASVADWDGIAGRRFEVELFLQEGGASQANYTLRVTHPR